MTLTISKDILAQIFAHGESSYPDEGAGFLLGYDDGEKRMMTERNVTLHRYSLLRMPVKMKRDTTATWSRHRNISKLR